MGPVYRFIEHVKPIIVMGLVITMTGCTADL